MPYKYVRSKTLKTILSSTGNQCSCLRSGVILYDHIYACLQRDMPHNFAQVATSESSTSWAGRKTTNYNDLHLHLTKACTSVLMLSSYEYFLILHFILKWRIQRYLLMLIWTICHLGYGWSSLWDIVKLSLQRSFMVSPEMINTVGTCIQHVYMYLANKIWQTFSTSSSKASCTPSFVLALKTRQRYTYVCMHKKKKHLFCSVHMVRISTQLNNYRR